MTISSALSAGVAGLNANATRLATISDNIANSGTYGYKRIETNFESFVTGGGGAGAFSAGGVRANTTRLIEERGPLIPTNNAMDIAVNQRGMLPVTTAVSLNGSSGGFPLMMTTTGSFFQDTDGVMKTESGLALLGWPLNSNGSVNAFPRDTIAGLEPVKINLTQTSGDPTTKMTLGVALPATETETGSSGNTIPLPVEYFGNLGTSESLGITFTPTVPTSGSSNKWTMEITDSAQAGAKIGEYTLVFDGTRASGGTLLSVTKVSGGDYDSATGTLDLTVAGGPLEMTIGSIGQANGLIQLSDSFSPTSVTKNGSLIGGLKSVEITETGFVTATYESGLTRPLYQVPLVDVPSPNGLTALSNQTYQVSLDSGAFFLWDAGDGPTGSVSGFSRESSKTDVAGELTALIETQRAYSSNAKIIQTVDEMLQETTNIKR